MERPEGLVNISDVLHYLQADRYMPLREASAYAGMKPKLLRSILPPELVFRVSGRKILVKRSELDEFLERYRERPRQDLERIVNDLVEDVFRK